MCKFNTIQLVSLISYGQTKSTKLKVVRLSLGIIIAACRIEICFLK